MNSPNPPELQSTGSKFHARVLIFPCGTEVGLELGRALSKARGVELVGASSREDHGRFAFPDYVGDIPFFDDPYFETTINTVCEEHAIDLIIPAHDDALLAFSELQVRGRLKARVVCAPPETVATSRSKRKTYQVLRNVLPVPVVYDTLEAVPNWPIFAKPDRGQGSKDTFRVADIHIGRRLRDEIPGLLFTEFLPGPEYTIDCLSDMQGNLLFAGARERRRVQRGISVNSAPVGDPRFIQLAEAINSRIAFRGMWFFQVKENQEGDLVLLEIAPRLAGTMALFRGLGVNFALLTLYMFKGFKVTPLINRFDIEIDRALTNRFHTNLKYDHLFVDFDDCLYLNGEINHGLMALIFKCHNSGKSVTLISRHDGDLHALLNELRLAGIFTEIIHITDGTPKSRFIGSGAILVDDSYAERAEVLTNAGVPVFSPDAVEVLVNS